MKNLRWLVSEKGLSFTFAVFYIVGVSLFSFPVTKQLFILITPYTLVLAAFVVFYYHKEWNLKTVFVLAFIFITSVIAEIIGVATGMLFGVYSYGVALGFKIAHVPVLIGLNWIILVYGSNAVISKISSNTYLKIIGASALMIVYDFVLEIAAPLMKMWEFDPIRPPIQNYLMWFVMALLFNSALEIFKVNTNNKPGRTLFLIQIVFFLVIVILN